MGFYLNKVFKSGFKMNLYESYKAVKESWYHRVVSSILKAGPLPEHVGFIMDGNRRYARSRSLKTIDGHSQGFEKLGEVLRWCHGLGINQVSVFAFSLENFKRSQMEIVDLMELAREKFSGILKEKQKIDEYGVRIRFVGNIKRLPNDLQEIVKKLERETSANSRCFLNVCVAYTSRYEMTEGIKYLVDGIKQKKLVESDVNEDLFNQVLKVPRVDLLLRTSGEIRLSDFLLWQSSFSLLSFVRSYWPELTIWQFYLAVLEYQYAFKAKQEICQKISQESQKEAESYCLKKSIDANELKDQR